MFVREIESERQEKRDGAFWRGERVITAIRLELSKIISVSEDNSTEEGGKYNFLTSLSTTRERETERGRQKGGDEFLNVSLHYERETGRQEEKKRGRHRGQRGGDEFSNVCLQ